MGVGGGGGVGGWGGSLLVFVIVELHDIATVQTETALILWSRIKLPDTVMVQI